MANPEQVVRILLEDDDDARSWPEFADMSDDEWTDYNAGLPLVWLAGESESLPCLLDWDNYFLIAWNPGDPSRRFASAEDLEDFLARHEKQEDVDIDAEKHIYTYHKEPDVPKYTLEQKRAHVVYEYGGYIFLKLPEDEDFIRREGVSMSHCLSTAHKDYVERMKKGEIEVYSMTDAETGEPVVDIEVALVKSSYSRAKIERPTVTQVRGIRNEMPPRDEYLEPLMAFFQDYGQSKGWQLTGHGVRNFDSRTDGDAVVRRWQQLQGER